MKKCPQCEQAYGDETNFCLSDGATLVSVSGSFTYDEAPTVYRNEPAPTVYNQGGTQPSYGGAPFVPPVSSAHAETPKSNTLLIALVVGLFALIAGGAVVGLVMYGLNSSGKTDANVANVSNSADKSNKSAPDNRETDERAEKLKQEKEKLEKDRQKLEEERRALEAKKKESTPSTPSSATTAIIIDPPSNIRATPNGAVLCVARTRGTIVNILGSTGIADNNGTWYYTDYCGRQGVIHSTQIRF